MGMQAYENEEGKIWKKLERREEKYIREQKMLRKNRTLELAALEEVFDKSTLMCLYKMFNEGVIKSFHGIISSGKEARVYGGEDSSGNPLAIKIYLTLTTEFRKTRAKYLMGDPRFPTPKFKDVKKIVNLWASKEFKNLKEAYEADVNVPKPIYWRKNIVIMEFIGENFTPAPTLKDLRNITEDIYKKVLAEVKKLYKSAKLVHADLSEYNVILQPDMHILIIDWPQYVRNNHPNAEQLLKRDLRNILTFFRKKRLLKANLDEVFAYVTGLKDSVNITEV